MVWHSHILYELYVRTVYTIFGCLLTVATLAAFASYNASGTAAVINIANGMFPIVSPLDSYPVKYMIKKTVPCAGLGIAAAIVSAVITNVLLKHHVGEGKCAIAILHIGIDSLTIALTLNAIPWIAEQLDIVELYGRH